MRNNIHALTFRKTGFPVMLFSLFILLTLHGICDGQTKLQTIDGVYIERTYWVDDPADPDPDTKLPKVDHFRLTQTNLVNGDVIAFDIPGVNDYMLENQRFLSKVLLIIDDIELPELQAYTESNESGVIRFRFNAKKLEPGHHQSLYKLPGKAHKEVLLGIKIDESNVLYFNVPANLYFKEIDNRGIYAWILVAFFGVFFWALIIRFRSFIKDGTGVLGNLDLEPRYSFGKSQFAFWTFIVFSSLIYIWIFTGDLQSINNTALILLGITTFTVTGSYITNISDNARESDPNNAGKPVKLRSKKKGSTSGFFEDILSDANGKNIQRLQALVFNLIFGIAFFKSVFTDYTMPDFSETQLILLGFSSGTYVFLKSTENK